jgi:glycosyltransferase involved in cell wall biosynthesis
MRQDKIDAIYATSPIPTAAMLGAWASRRSGMPFLVDFRDPWRLDTLPRLLPGLGRLNEVLEARTLRFARKISVVRQSQKEELLLRFPDLSENRIAVIPNGYDSADFDELSPFRFDKFTIVYSGVFHPNRGPEPILRAAACACRSKPELHRNLQIIFVGRPDHRVPKIASKLGITDLVKCVGYQSHRESLRYIGGAHLLYLNTLGNYIPGKTYEYLASQAPILALVEPQTEVAEIIRRIDAGEVVAPSDTTAAADAIAEYYKQYKSGNPSRRDINEPRITRYERRNQAGQLAHSLDTMVSQHESEKPR